MRNTINKKILSVSIPIYFTFVLILTFFQIIIEYQRTRSFVLEDLKTYQTTFEKGVAQALWEIDNSQIENIAKGIVNLPSVSGVIVKNKNSDMVTKAHNKLYTDILNESIKNSFNLSVYRHNKTIQIGQMIIYSSPQVIFQKIKYGIMYIVLNSIVISLVLWLIFSWLINKFLTKSIFPISTYLSNLDLNQINLQRRFDIQPSDPIEIQTLGNAFNEMLSKLSESKQIIDNNNKNLEQTVKEKTTMLLETMNKWKENQATVTHLAKLTSLGEMAGGIAHEINNPLTIISGNIYFLKKMMKTGVFDPTLYKESVESIANTVERISLITNGLLTFSRKDDNQDYQAESIKSIVDKTVILCGEKFKTQGVKLIQENVTNNVVLDCKSIQISQVLLNLLNNAYYAIKSLDDKWVNITVKEKDEWIDILVTDSGNGIPPEIREKIMQPFFTSKKEGEGTGLGLSISLGIIQNHGGTMTVNEHCPNTQFVLHLPKYHKKISIEDSVKN